ncbi:hypothetical protein D7V80_40480, partial [Corallococcus sp. CA054B]|uniref:condensation domain-containing protein n=1 Tax=Corallococcus sp. CA054B TaxID=2316734 RepID=UPI000ED33ACC
NGKLDRRGLPAPDLSGSREAYVAPRTELERRLAAIFSDVLGLQHIGVHDNFFDLGGHSLLASQVVSKIARELGIQISIASLFQRPTIHQLCELIEGLDARPQWEISPAPAESAEAVLSFAQERMWFLHNFVKGVPYNTPGLVRLTGELDVAALERALRALIVRHEPLRTNFVEKGGVLSQVVGSEARFQLPLTSLRDEGELSRAMKAAFQTPFDLERDLMIQAHLYRFDSRNHALFATIHHIAFDGWSQSVFFRELAACYAASLRGEDTPLPALEISYREYSRWERAYFQDAVLAEHLRYWRHQLAGAQPLLLPTTFPRPPIQDFAGAVVNFTLPQSLTERLKRLSVETDTTLYMVLLAAWAVVLQRYSGQEDICVGAPVANRSHVQTEGLIGLFVNTLVMRVDVAGNPRFRDLLARVRKTAVEAYAHQEVPFEKIVEELQLARDTVRSPLAQVVLNFHNTPHSALELPGVTAFQVPVHNGTSKFELTLDVAETSAGLSGFIEYATALFSESFARGLLGHLEVVLDAACREPGAFIDDLPLLTPREEQELLARSRPEAFIAMDVELLPRVFEQRVRAHPEAVALVHGDERVSYRALNGRANQIARHLRASGVGPNSLVGLCVGRSNAWVSGVLGILKAGGAYVPIDPDASAEAIYDVLYESKVRFLLTESRLVEGLPVDDQELLLLDPHPDASGDTAVLERQESHDLGDVGLTSECLAYVLFASEAGGAPRAVAFQHGAVARRMAECHEQYLAGVDARFLLKAPPSFDLSVAELFQWMFSGGSLSVLAPGAERAPSALLDQVKRDLIRVLYTVPAELSAWVGLLEREGDRVHALDTLRLIFCGGDTLPVTLARRLGALARAGGLSLRLINLFGTKETGLGVCSFECALDANGDGAEPSDAPRSHERMPIRGPSARTLLYVVQSNGSLAPVGVPGELYVGGEQLASRSFASAAANPGFVPAPFGSQHGNGWVFRTGDLVRWLPEGSLELVGSARERGGDGDRRVDRGFVASRLLRLEVVHDAVVVMAPTRQGGSRLVAYVVLREPFATEVEHREARKAMVARINAGLRSTLAEYMLPAAYVFMGSLPLTAHGRIHWKAFPEAEDDLEQGRDDSYVAPRGPIEKALAGIWQQVLRRARIGLRDNFFDLGGHSLSAVQVVSAIRRELGVRVPITLLFEAPVLEELARAVEVLRQQGGG